MEPPASVRYDIAPGTSVRVLEWPGGSLVPVLLVHGLASNALTWSDVAARLAEAGHPVAAIDQRGHGDSDRVPELSFDLDDFVTDLRKVLARMGWERAVLAGQSFGGNVVVETARRHPTTVAAAVGVDGGLIQLADQFPTIEACLMELAPPRYDGVTLEELERWIRSRNPGWPEAGIRGTLANLEVEFDGSVRNRLPRDAHLAILRSLWTHRPQDTVGDVRVPIRFLLAEDGGRRAEENRAAAERAAAASRRVEVIVMRGHHDLHVEVPEVVAGHIAEVSARIPT